MRAALECGPYAGREPLLRAKNSDSALASTAANCVWVLPGSHKRGKADIKKMVAEAGSDRIEGAVPMLCDAGDTIVTNRQLVHGSFANSSPDRRITLNEGFFPRRRVLNVTTKRLNGVVETYDEARIAARTR